MVVSSDSTPIFARAPFPVTNGSEDTRVSVLYREPMWLKPPPFNGKHRAMLTLKALFTPLLERCTCLLYTCGPRAASLLSQLNICAKMV